MGRLVYILECADGSYYVGSTQGPDAMERRLHEHQTGALGGHTANRRPVTLVWCEFFETIVDALACERRLKGWSRAKKQALIAGRYDLLPALASSSKARRESAEREVPGVSRQS